jgi:hypothetical protein
LAHQLASKFGDLPIEGMAETIRVNIDFDAGVVDQMIDRLARA